jgi:hypothetical protein
MALLLISARAVSGAPPADEKKIVAHAQQRYQQVNARLKAFRVVKKELEGFSLEGGDMTAYFAGEHVRKPIRRVVLR